MRHGQTAEDASEVVSLTGSFLPTRFSLGVHPLLAFVGELFRMLLLAWRRQSGMTSGGALDWNGVLGRRSAGALRAFSVRTPGLLGAPGHSWRLGGALRALASGNGLGRPARRDPLCLFLMRSVPILRARRRLG